MHAAPPHRVASPGRKDELHGPVGSQSALFFPPHLVPPDFPAVTSLFPCSYYICAHLRLSVSLFLLLTCCSPVPPRPSSHFHASSHAPRLQCLGLPSRAHPVLCCLIAICLPFFPSPLPYPAVSLTLTSLAWSPPAFLHPLFALEPRAINRHPKHICTNT